jgi:hypothetical protein
MLIVCFLILLSPHLVTLVSIMHNYAALSMAALVVGFVSSHIKAHAWLITSFTLYIAAALFTDWHHYEAARQSGLLGQRLARQAIKQAKKPLEHVLCISIDNADEPRYSSFCVRPVDAFAWGLSVRHYSHYTWKTRIDETTLPQFDQQQIQTIADSALNSSCEAVWVVGCDKDNLIIMTK